jgi:hypothetical protein
VQDNSFFIVRARFATLYREHVDHINTHQPADYAWILQYVSFSFLRLTPSELTFSAPRMDMKLVEVLDNLPLYFRDPSIVPDDSQTPSVSNLSPHEQFAELTTSISQLLKESIILNATAESRLLRLHRPYLSRGYNDPKYAASRDRCVHSARNLLALVGVAGRRCPTLLKFWILVFFTFSAVSEIVPRCS